VSDIEISGNFFDGGFSNFNIAVNAITGSPAAVVQDILVNDNWYTADITTFLQPGPAINLQSSNNQLVTTIPLGLAGLENSIFTELEVYFSAQEITSALQGSGVSRIAEIIFADSFDDG
ncbi:MAG: hypothetical protein L3J83_08730, partial [Proteobacteria bacterium]|nr:hypothetical protein [Pseudomonadota bacterium]